MANVLNLNDFVGESSKSHFLATLGASVRKPLGMSLGIGSGYGGATGLLADKQDPNRIVSTKTKTSGWGLTVTVEQTTADGKRIEFVDHDASNNLVVEKFRGTAQEQAVLRIKETRQAERWQSQQVALACWESAKSWV